jgi:di/tricarboxylate transporter
MTTERERVSALKISSFLAILTLVGIVAVASAFPGNHAQESAVALPRVTSVTQVTHDGFNKTSLLSDDSHLYVSESPAAHHVIARISLHNSNRSVMPSTTVL